MKYNKYARENEAENSTKPSLLTKSSLLTTP